MTNFSINKKAKNYQFAKGDGDGEGEEENSSKWSLTTLRAYFKKNLDLDFEVTWKKIKDLIVKACLTVEPTLANNLNRAGNGRRLCFELFGFDVILDHNLRPWLLEVNVLPSLSSSSELDKRIKTSLLCDTFNTLGIIPYNKKKHQKSNNNQKWKKFVGLKDSGKDSSGSRDPVEIADE